MADAGPTNSGSAIFADGQHADKDVQNAEAEALENEHGGDFVYITPTNGELWGSAFASLHGAIKDLGATLRLAAVSYSFSGSIGYAPVMTSARFSAGDLQDAVIFEWYQSSEIDFEAYPGNDVHAEATGRGVIVRRGDLRTVGDDTPREHAWTYPGSIAPTSTWRRLAGNRLSRSATACRLRRSSSASWVDLARM